MCGLDIGGFFILVNNNVNNSIKGWILTDRDPVTRLQLLRFLFKCILNPTGVSLEYCIAKKKNLSLEKMELMSSIDFKAKVFVMPSPRPVFIS